MLPPPSLCFVADVGSAFGLPMNFRHDDDLIGATDEGRCHFRQKPQKEGRKGCRRSAAKRGVILGIVIEMATRPSSCFRASHLSLRHAGISQERAPLTGAIGPNISSGWKNEHVSQLFQVDSLRVSLIPLSASTS